MKMIKDELVVRRLPAEGRPDPRPAPPLRCAVLAWDGWEWVTITVNGDEGDRNDAVEKWLEANPHSECQLMVAQQEGRAKLVTRVEWGK